MLCEVCGKNEANVHIKKLMADGSAQERNLCEECAAKEGLIEDAGGMPLPFAEFLKNIIPIAFEEAFENIELTCPNCGISYGDMKHDGKFGCAACYTAFKDHVPEILKIVQGKNESHIGKSPKTLSELPPEKELYKLRKSLEIAISEEAYERAAEYRDRIKELEKRARS